MEKVLTIAGSDSSGGAGIQADLKTFAANGAYGMSVIVALTAQNTQGVTGIVNIEGDFVEEQMDRVFEDIYPDAVKIGMVSDREIILAIKNKLIEYDAKNIVLDPVMVATSGSKLLEDSASQALIEELIPLASVITPNMAEASVLSGIDVRTREDMERAAELIADYYKGYILIKGGHLEDGADDLLYHAGDFNWFEGERLDNENTHGTGCTLSSALAVYLARGYSMAESVERARAYLRGAIEDGLDLGRGRGPLNHIYNIKKER